MELYRRLRSVALDQAKAYHVRDASIDREDLHISLNEGTVAFTEAVDGRITGAYFVGDGEVLLVPPDQGERASLALFTNAAVLEEKFRSAYFRFADDHFFTSLEPGLRAEPDAAIFTAKWNPAARNLSEADALRLLLAFTNKQKQNQTFIHARFSGMLLGTFDVVFDTLAPEQITTGQLSFTQQGAFYDVWMQFPMRSRRIGKASNATAWSLSYLNPVAVKKFTMVTKVLPPTDLVSEATLELTTVDSGLQTLVFELSRFLKVSSVTLDGQPIEFVQNEALQGSELGRKGNDLIAVVLPRPLGPEKTAKLRFHYAGAVLSDAGNGLLRVGARGIWYPNLGFVMSDFDLEFHYPQSWTLLATGKHVSQAVEGTEQVARWISSEPIPVAGFNLGHYESVNARAADVEITTFAARDVESTFPMSRPSLSPALPPGIARPQRRTEPATLPPLAPASARPTPNLQKVAEQAAATIDYLVPRIGPFPFPNLEITQMPGALSQGWPGLIFLSSYAFVTPQESVLHNDPYAKLLFDQIMGPHEIAHQWWGDAVSWSSYRDQWISESFANYCALLPLEQSRPENFRLAMNHYAHALLERNKSGKMNAEAGPVTQGVRLTSSRIPSGYETIVYGRGTWLVHMLRMMFRDGWQAELGNSGTDPDAIFFAVLKSIQQQYTRKQMTTVDLQQSLERALPKSLYLENRPSLDWFFEGWVNGTSVPTYQLENVQFHKRGTKTIATATLLQKDAPEHLITSVPIYVAGPASKPQFVARVFADGSETSVALAVPAASNQLLVDPFETVLSRR